LVFLTTVLAFSYTSSRDVIFQEADKNIDRLVQQIEGQLQRERRELQERVTMIRDNVQIQEYLFVVVTLDTDRSALNELYQRQFGWLPISRVVLLGKSGKPLLGGEYSDLVKVLHERNPLHDPRPWDFYHYDQDGLQLIVTAPVYYRGEFLGIVAISKLIGAEWLRATGDTSKGHLFMVHEGKVILSTLKVKNEEQEFKPHAGIQPLQGEEFHVQRIKLYPIDKNIPTLWFARSEASMTRILKKQLSIILGLVAAGCVAILVVGFMMLKNFSTPLGRLVNTINEVSEGRFPTFPETDAKDELGYLSNQIASMVRNLRDKQREISEVHSQLEEQASTDSLTGLYNRRHLFDLFPKLLSEAHRQKKNLIVILGDLDHFKKINDQFGHLVGDECLVHFTKVLRECSRISDFVFRIGGEEFLLISTGNLDGGLILAEKIRTALESAPLRANGQVIPVTVSLGVTCTDPSEGARSLEAALSRADHAMYAAKKSGRNRVAGWDVSLKSA